MKKKNTVINPIQDLENAAKFMRALRTRKKCFKVNSCKYEEHSPECEKCLFYRKK